MFKSRYLEQAIIELCFSDNKMAFVSGPRQCGKTTMAKRLLQERGAGGYYNWDETKFRRLWAKDPSLIIDKNIISDGKGRGQVFTRHTEKIIEIKALSWRRVFTYNAGLPDLLIFCIHRLLTYRIYQRHISFKKHR